MNAGLNRCTLVVQSLVTATIILVGINSAQAQNPADLIPPDPDSYAGGNTSQNTAMAAYRVIIPSDNSTLLNQAKEIEPTAFIQSIDGQRVIQVGFFSTEALAVQQIARFQAVGIPVRMQQRNSSNTPVGMPQTFLSSTTIQTTAMPPDRPSAPPTPYFPPVGNPSRDSTTTNTFNTSSNRGFYVVIPTVEAEVSYVKSQLSQVGIPPQYILFRDRPFGLHYAIGTFSKRSEAERLSDIIRDRTKFDARVYHER